MIELKILLNIELGTNKGKRYKALFLPRMVHVYYGCCVSNSQSFPFYTAYYICTDKLYLALERFPRCYSSTEMELVCYLFVLKRSKQW